MRTLTCLATLLLASLSAGAARAGNHGFPVDWSVPSCAGAAARLPPCKPYLGGYKLAFDDEFDTLRLGNDGVLSPWYAGVHPLMASGDKMAFAGDPWAYTVSGGVLTLSTRYAGSQYVEVDMETFDNHGHGFAKSGFYAEIRARGPQVDGAHSGIWFLSTDTGKADTTGGHAEFDLVEQYGPSDQFDHSSTHIWPGARQDIDHVYTSTLTSRPEGKASAWHVYGVMATSDLFVIYRDGVAIKQVPRQALQRKDLHLILSMVRNADAGVAPAATMLVDYVRIWTPQNS